MDTIPRSSWKRVARLAAVGGLIVGCGAPNEPLGRAQQPARSLLFEKAKAPLLPKDLREGDRFGTSIGVSSRWAAIGSPGDDFDDAAAFDETGSAIVFARTQGNVWKEIGTRLRPPKSFPDAQFGRAIAATDSFIALGAQEADPVGDGTKWGAGLVATFVQRNGAWQFESLLHDPFEDEDRFFGAALAMDDKTLLVGAYGGDQVFAFTRTASGWTDPTTLNSPSPFPVESYFGYSVALQDPYAFVGAPQDDGDGSAEQRYRGAVYVFKRTESGWALSGHLERNTFDSGDLFGFGLAVRNGLAVATAYGDISATTFRLDAGGQWSNPRRMVPSDAANTSAFGRSVAIGARDSVWIGASREQSFNGVAFPFLLEEGGWVESTGVSFTDEGRFGYSMASASGALMVGAPLAGTENQGAVYVIETSDGSICTQDDDCFSTHCVGGICCNTSCDDVCHSCLASEKAAGGVDGTCEPKRAGSPDDACAVEPAASCGTTGACDAAGKCAKHRAGTQCAEPFCSGNSFVGPAVCDGAGDCEPPAATVCKSYMCQDGACQDSCSATADCAPGFYCVDGRCRHQTGLGAACDSKAACQSGHCVDGVCCDRDCNGHCEACAEPDNEGTCIALSAGAPPRVDVRDASSDVNVCARLSCDGVERDVATLPAPAGVVCSPAGCSGDAEVSEGRCDGTGQCLSAPLKECGAYACGSDGDGRPPQCLTTCASIDDCAPDFYCSTNHECRRVEVPGPNARGCNVRPWATPDDWSCLPAALGLAVLGLRRRRMNPQGIPAS